MSGYVVPMSLMSAGRPLPTHVSLECLPVSFPCQEPLRTAEPVTKRSSPTAEMRSAYPLLAANAVLQQFLRAKTGSVRVHPKLENLRSSVMRCFKKTIRVITSGKPQKYCIKKLPQDSGIFAERYSKMKDCVSRYADFCRDFSVARSGPQVDSHRSKSDFKTYNNSYLKSIFSADEMCVLFACFIELLFSDPRPEGLCERFELMCCESSRHSEKCEQKWFQLRRVLDEHLGVEVGSSTGHNSSI